MATYNGHKNWTHWNVSLWIGNDEGLYNMAKDCIRQARNWTAQRAREVYGVRKSGKDLAAHFMMASLPAETPDGAKYSVTAIRAAMVGM